MRKSSRKLIPWLFGIRENTTKRPVIEWIDIPAGTFIMGSPLHESARQDDESQHQVTLSDFKMSKYLITFEQYDIFCEITGRSKPSDFEFGRKKHPALNISWDNAAAFAKWMGCHLPTEAEWEYACRAGTTTAYNTGDNLSDSMANFKNCNPPDQNPPDQDPPVKINGKTLPVGSFEPNSWGLCDMHGNVMEWCSDWYGDYLLNTQENPIGPAKGVYKVLRGGSWCDPVQNCRSACRNSLNPNFRNNNIGFRIVMRQHAVL